jgi:hypothetical protein
MVADRPKVAFTTPNFELRFGLRLGALLGLVLGLVPNLAFGQVGSVPASPHVQMTPHRAIYEMALDDSTAGSNVANVRGRLVFDFTGSTCDGYTLNTRLVTQIIDRDGRLATSDVRSSSWEQGNAGQFRFHSSQYLNQKLSEAVGGKAARKESSESIAVALERPAKSEIKLQGKAMFPTQHSLAILDAASQGRTVLQADLYDGSEKGDKVYETTTFIGKPLPPGANKVLKPVKNAEPLDGLTSWPVAISYFNQSQPGEEGTPTYQLGFRLYANGVSRNLHIDYGNFSLTGELSRLEFYNPQDCGNRPAATAQAAPQTSAPRKSNAGRKSR